MSSKNLNKKSIGLFPLGFVACIVLVMTLEPFRFSVVSNVRLLWIGSIGDIANNVLLFVPLGFLFGAGRRKQVFLFNTDVFIAAVIFSSVIETIQVFIPERYTTFSDVVANGFGAWSDALHYDFLRKQPNEETVSRVISLNLPLSVIIYLLVPVIWLMLLAGGGFYYNLFLTLLPVTIAGMIITSVYVNRLKGTAVSRKSVVLFSLCWLILSCFPILFDKPVFVTGLAFYMAGLTLVLIRTPGLLPEKRFESITLKRVLPVYVVYLLLLFSLPVPDSFSRFSIIIGPNISLLPPDQFIPVQMAEFIAVYTLLGYMTASLRSRINETAVQMLFMVFWVTTACAVLISVFRGFHPFYSASLTELFLSLFAGSCGGMLYFRLKKTFTD